MRGAGRRLLQGGSLALRALLTEGPDVCIHIRPKESISQLGQGVVGPQVASELVAVGQVRQGPSLEVENDQEVTQLSPAFCPELQEPFGYHKIGCSGCWLTPSIMRTWAQQCLSLLSSFCSFSRFPSRTT